MDRKDVINKVIQEFTPEFIETLVKSSTKINEDTGAGRRSFKASLNLASDEAVASILVSFNEYLRYPDMKRVTRSGKPTRDMIGALTRWVKRRGVDKFMKKYSGQLEVREGRGRPRKDEAPVFKRVDEARIINNIVWGIARTKRNIKRKKWYASTQEFQMAALSNELFDKLDPFLLQEIAEKLSTSKK